MTARNSNTMFIGNPVISLEEVDSTNSYALRMIRNSNVTEGTVVTSRFQSEGRGQRGANWSGEKGANITCSIILKPGFLLINSQFDLNRVVALGIVDVMKDLFPLLKIEVKWPNDIYISDKKLGGILIENMIAGQNITHSVIGIGINLNQLDFPAELPNAVSIRQLTGEESDINDALSYVFEGIEARYIQLRSGKTDRIRIDYLNVLYRLNKKARFTDYNSVFDGEILDVTAEGKLVVKKEDGAIEEFGFKEIGFLN